MFVAFPFHEARRADDLPRADAVIVFTGAHERIHAGLDLLAEGVAPLLFISGANPSAGIWLDRFRRQFGAGRPEIERLIDCCVIFGELAETTYQNGLESRCWLDSKGLKGTVVLVTSKLHMPRSMAVANRFLGGRRIAPFPVASSTPGADEDVHLAAQEFLKHIVTLAALRAPRWAVGGLYGAFHDDCPAARVRDM